jgi:putative membrane protein
VKALRILPGVLVFFFVFGGEGLTAVFGRVGALGATALLALVVGGASWLSWRRLTFWFDDEGDLRVHSGVFQRKERRVQVSRLQSVDVSQPLVARLFGLAVVRPEVAGSSSGQTTLEYLALDDANRLRADLLARAAGLAVSDDGSTAPEAPENVLVQVPAGTLLASVMLQPLTAVALVVVPVLFGVALVSGSWQFALPTVLIVLSPFFVIINQFLNWFDFTVAESPDGLRLRFGLLSHRSQTVPPGRVQAVRLECPLLWQPWGWARVTVNVAGGLAGDEEGERPAVILPVAPLAVARAIVAQVLPGVDPMRLELTSAPRRARWRSPLQSRRLAVGHDASVFVARHGWLVPKWDVVPHARTQSVRLTQGPWQRRLDLASVHVDSTPGPIRVTADQRDAGTARQLLADQARRARLARQSAAPDKWLSKGVER